jgi:transposase-like protein
MAGAPTKLTPEVQAEIVRNLAGGCYIETACAVAGIGTSTYYRWMQWAEEGLEPYAGFRDAVREAEHKAELRALAIIMREGEKDPKHLEWWLERKFNDRWGRKDSIKQEVTGTGGAPMQVIIRGFTDAETDTDDGNSDEVPAPE